VLPGYSGGHVDNPSYEQVCGKDTGHIEVPASNSIRPSFPTVTCCASSSPPHDPTTPGRQGNDIGPQYESAIFWQNDAQREQAEAVIAEVDARKIYDAPIVTKVLAPPSSGRPKTITAIISPCTPSKAIANSSSRPRWPSSASSSRTA